MIKEWQPPRCIHGYIILGCPHDDCPTQVAYLDQQQAVLRDYYARQAEIARAIADEWVRRVRDLLTPIIESVTASFVQLASTLTDGVQRAMSILLTAIDEEDAVRRLAIECADIPESDIRSVDVDTLEVRLWNGRRVSLEYLVPA